MISQTDFFVKLCTQVNRIIFSCRVKLLSQIEEYESKLFVLSRTTFDLSDVLEQHTDQKVIIWVRAIYESEVEDVRFSGQRVISVTWATHRMLSNIATEGRWKHFELLQKTRYCTSDDNNRCLQCVLVISVGILYFVIKLHLLRISCISNTI